MERAPRRDEVPAGGRRDDPPGGEQRRGALGVLTGQRGARPVQIGGEAANARDVAGLRACGGGRWLQPFETVGPRSQQPLQPSDMGVLVGGRRVGRRLLADAVLRRQPRGADLEGVDVLLLGQRPGGQLLQLGLRTAAAGCQQGGDEAENENEAAHSRLAP
jgi:hypothetical protein